MNERPKVGVGILIFDKEGRILLGKRKNAQGSGKWALPGGHLEFREEIEDCAKREIKEEVGIEVKNLKKFTFANEFFAETNKHYVNLYLTANYISGEVKLMEPNKCEGWKWFKTDELPNPLMINLKEVIEEYASLKK